MAAMRRRALGAISIALCLHFCHGRELKALIPPAQLEQLYNLTQLQMTLVKPGIRGYLYQNADYSSFLTMAQAVPAYDLLLNGAWAQGPTNNTVLVPTNEALESAFVTIGQGLGIDANVSDYLGLVNSTLGLTAIQQPLQTIFSAVLDSHILTAPINLYANPQIQNATQTSPFSLPVRNLSALDTPLAYSDATETIYVLQPTGLISTPVMIPEFYAQQSGGQIAAGNTSLYLYEVDTALVADSIQNGTQSVGVTAAFRALQQYV